MFHPYLLLLPFQKRRNIHLDKMKNFDSQPLCGKSAKVKPGPILWQVCHWYLINPLSVNGLVSRFILSCTSTPTAIVCVLFQERCFGFFSPPKTASILKIVILKFFWKETKIVFCTDFFKINFTKVGLVVKSVSHNSIHSLLKDAIAASQCLCGSSHTGPMPINWSLSRQM